MQARQVPSWLAMAYRLYRVHGPVMSARYGVYMLTAGITDRWEWWLRDVVPSQGRVAIDAGASFGQWSAFLARRFQRVVSFEPDPSAARKLSRRMPANVLVRREAVWQDKGVMQIVTYPDSRVNRLVPHDLTYAIGNGTGVAVVHTIAIDMLGLTKVDFIKLDVEGAEVCALRGARRTICNSHPVILIELHSRAADTVIRSMLSEWGYEWEYRHFPFYRPTDPMYHERLWLVARLEGR